MNPPGLSASANEVSTQSHCQFWGESWKELRSAFAVSSASSSRASRASSTSAIAMTAKDDQACLGPATPIFQKNTSVWRGRIRSIPASATPGLESIIISVRIAVSLCVGPARKDRCASAFRWAPSTIPHFPRHPCRSGRPGVTHGRPRFAVSRIGTPNRHRGDASSREVSRARPAPQQIEISPTTDITADS
jgi:hypothetical protein